MKKIIALALCLMLCTVSVFAAAEGLPGSWQVCEDSTVTPEAAAALEEALQSFVGSDLEPVALLAVQAVAGTNYCLLCRVTPVVPDPVSQYALVYVSSPLEGTAVILTIEDLELGVWG